MTRDEFINGITMMWELKDFCRAGLLSETSSTKSKQDMIGTVGTDTETSRLWMKTT